MNTWTAPLEPRTVALSLPAPLASGNVGIGGTVSTSFVSDTDRFGGVPDSASVYGSANLDAGSLHTSTISTHAQPVAGGFARVGVRWVDDITFAAAASPTTTRQIVVDLQHSGTFSQQLNVGLRDGFTMSGVGGGGGQIARFTQFDGETGPSGNDFPGSVDVLGFDDGWQVVSNDVGNMHFRGLVSDTGTSKTGRHRLKFDPPGRVALQAQAARPRHVSWSLERRHTCLFRVDPRSAATHRGHSGIGVWRVERPVDDGLLTVQHARRGSVPQRMDLPTLQSTLAPEFEPAAGDHMLDQAWQPRLAEGMVRAHLVEDRIAGFGHQAVNALHPDASTPGPRLCHDAEIPAFQALRRRLESNWVSLLCERIGPQCDRLPLPWDCEFMLGEPAADGAERFVLCEINGSSVSPFPHSAMAPLVDAVRRCIGE